MVTPTPYSIPLSPSGETSTYYDYSNNDINNYLLTMETTLTIIAIAAAVVVVFLMIKFYKKATEMPNENPK